jgi:cyclohexanone monooxygenase
MSKFDLDVAIVGAGFAGLFALYRMRGLGLNCRVFETAEEIGGTWHWNCYPGARCDVESLQYSYQFSPELQQEWEWSERYAAQPEILRYLNHVADRFGLRNSIQLSTKVIAATFSERGSPHWTIKSSSGDEVTARWLIMATGCLSRPYKPQLPDMHSFAGDVYHTGEWPKSAVNFTGKRVGVVGTGSSAIQCIPFISKNADEVVVLQRTAAYSVPAHNGPLDSVQQRKIKSDYAGFRARCSAQLAAIDVGASTQSALAVNEAERKRVYEERWARGGLGFMGAFADLRLSREANFTAAEYVRGKIREIVNDSCAASRLSPMHLIGCKRLCVDTDYYQAFNRQNVRLVDIRSDPITSITTTGLKTREHRFELDCLIFATGFDAMTGALLAIDIRGRDGVRLKDAWAEGPKTYLGLGVAGFPNLFLISGPGSPSVLTNMVVSIEQHVNWIADCIGQMESRGIGSLEAHPDSQNLWVDHVNNLALGTLFPECGSWYLGANVPGKARVFMPYVGGFPTYCAKCDEVAANGYRGFQLTASKA